MMSVDLSVIHRLLPLSVVIGPMGEIRSSGVLMTRLLADETHLQGAFSIGRRKGRGYALPEHIFDAVHEGRDIHLRQRQSPHLRLRGQGAMMGDGVLLILGFGASVVEAVRRLHLTRDDFAASELAIELLFLHEANQQILSELSRFTLRLNEAREQAEAQALTDPLTGLSNRRGMELALARAFEGAGSGAPFAVVQIDLDHFKAVNDTYGHGAGDEVLIEVAAILKKAVRAGDTVARMGGDEFLILLRGECEGAALAALGTRIIQQIEAPISTQSGVCHISASIGAARVGRAEHRRYGQTRVAAENLLRETDAALYRSKREGRGRVTLLDDLSHQKASLPNTQYSG